MSAKHQEKPQPGAEKQNREHHSAFIVRQVMQVLGQPLDLMRVQAHHLWDSRYRVNVFVGVDAASARVANSFFLVADNEGNILASTPKIAKQY